MTNTATLGTPDFGAVDFTQIWTIVSALVGFLSIPIVISMGITLGRRVAGAVINALHG